MDGYCLEEPYQFALILILVYKRRMFSAISTIFLSSFLIALSGALMPGPLMTVTVSESSRRGISTGPLMILGHGILELLLVAALLSGLAPILLRDDVFIGISLVGGVILLWMAISMIKELPSLCLDMGAKEVENRSLIVSGMVLSAANPYWLIWWATIGLGYIIYSAKFGIIGVTAFFLGHILADLVWYAAISYGIVKGKHLFSDRSYRRLIGGCAIFLIIFSGYFLYSGIEKLV